MADFPMSDVVLTVRGNCGVVHASFEEWQKCRACDFPPKPLTWRDWILRPSDFDPETTESL